jgi:DNA adenine methylase
MSIPPKTLQLDRPTVTPFKSQLLKWIGNKQRFAHEIVGFFPKRIGTYREPFLGSGAVLGTLAPAHAVGSDVMPALVEIWKQLEKSPKELCRWYAERYHIYTTAKDPKTGYAQILDSFNERPNGADLLFLCRSCYGGVVRFRQRDGFMSTPCGVHAPVNPASFEERVRLWGHRLKGTTFALMDFEEALDAAKPGDLVYCDPPYVHSQAILYRGQGFSLERLMTAIERCKSRGVNVALSIDGSKKSGKDLCKLEIPEGLFLHEAYVNCGRSMLRRFQMIGETLEEEVVHDRLLLTYSPD